MHRNSSKSLMNLGNTPGRKERIYSPKFAGLLSNSKLADSR
jgi:hypothetical protein